jgi:hypothetical protein
VGNSAVGFDRGGRKPNPSRRHRGEFRCGFPAQTRALRGMNDVVCSTGAARSPEIVAE